MILHQLKGYYRTGEAVTQEFAALMNATFTYYNETRSQFFDKLPAHLHQSELISFVNVEIKTRLFDSAFCESIQDALKNLRRAIIRLEDLRRAHPNLPEYINDLERLADLAEQVEALYQKHWEYYRYQNRLSEVDLVELLLEIDRIGRDWGGYLDSARGVAALVRALSGRTLPDDMAALRVTYQRQGADHFSVDTLKALLDFLASGYKFICAIHEADAEARPLTLLQVELASPVELELAVPLELEEGYARLLQYLFLKDLLRREPLLKVVFEAIQRDFGRTRLTPAALSGFQKDLMGHLKRFPVEGVFTISDRAFPADGIAVMREFIVSLEERNIPHDALFAAEKGAPRARKRTAPLPAAAPPAEPPLAAPMRDGNGPARPTKDHIPLLTEKAVP